MKSLLLGYTQSEGDKKEDEEDGREGVREAGRRRWEWMGGGERGGQVVGKKRSLR